MICNDMRFYKLLPQSLSRSSKPARASCGMATWSIALQWNCRCYLSPDWRCLVLWAPTPLSAIPGATAATVVLPSTGYIKQNPTPPWWAGATTCQLLQVSLPEKPSQLSIALECSMLTEAAARQDCLRDLNVYWVSQLKTWQAEQSSLPIRCPRSSFRELCRKLQWEWGYSHEWMVVYCGSRSVVIAQWCAFQSWILAVDLQTCEPISEGLSEESSSGLMAPAVALGSPLPHYSAASEAQLLHQLRKDSECFQARVWTVKLLTKLLSFPLKSSWRKLLLSWFPTLYNPRQDMSCVLLA